MSDSAIKEADSWLRNQKEGFGTFSEADEFYHGRNGVIGDSLTETWYWNFAVPEAGINCHVYCWVHPNLDVVTSGLFVYRGIKKQNLASELFCVHDYLSIDVISGDGHDIRVPNSLRMQVIEPLKHIHMTFDDPVRSTRIDVHMRAVHDPVMRTSNKHFEQVMHCKGTMTLRGEDFAVDSYKVRDRSWGELRPEGNYPLPAYSWLTGVFDEGRLAFNFCAHDELDSVPEKARSLVVPADQIFKDGWVQRNGRSIRVKHGTKRTLRDPEMLIPLRHELTMEDLEGNTYRMMGEIISSVPWNGWSNHACHLAQAKWTMDDGRIGYGESQDGQWNDYVYLMSK